MNAAEARASWNRILRNNQLLTGAVIALVVVNTILVSAYFSKDQIITLNPPDHHESVTIAKNSADEEYKRSFAVYAATLIGNITPGNADLVIPEMSKHFDPRIYNAIRSAMASQIEDLKLHGIALAFMPQQVTVNKEMDYLFVTGLQTLTAPGAERDKRETTPKTFEMQIAVDNYRPRITHFDFYEGKPKRYEIEEK